LFPQKTKQEHLYERQFRKLSPSGNESENLKIILKFWPNAYYAEDTLEGTCVKIQSPIITSY
jgi:hypothetical protein